MVNQDDVEWKIEGERIVPKSIYVSLLNRASFSKTFIFNRIRKQYFEASFQRYTSIYTDDFRVDHQCKSSRLVLLYQLLIRMIRCSELF
jgi:hypothetical protein